MNASSCGTSNDSQKHPTVRHSGLKLQLLAEKNCSHLDVVTHAVPVWRHSKVGWGANRTETSMHCVAITGDLFGTKKAETSLHSSWWCNLDQLPYLSHRLQVHGLSFTFVDLLKQHYVTFKVILEIVGCWVSCLSHNMTSEPPTKAVSIWWTWDEIQQSSFSPDGFILQYIRN